MFVDENSGPNIRDRREKNWFWADNVLMDDYAAVLGIHAVGVYMVLARRADNMTQTARVSGGVIAEKLGIGRTTVSDAMLKLELHQLIDIEERTYEDGGQAPSIYTLLPRSQWTTEPTGERREFVGARREEHRQKRVTPKKERSKSNGEGNGGYAATRHTPSPVQQRYAATRQGVSQDTASPMPSHGIPSPSHVIGLPSDGISYRNQDSLQDLVQDFTQTFSQNQQQQPDAPRVVDVVEETSPSAAELPPPIDDTTQNELPLIVGLDGKRLSEGETFCVHKLIDAGVAMDVAVAEVATWDVARFDRKRLKVALGEAQVWMAGKTGAPALLKEHGDNAVRWQLCLWPHTDESRDTQTDKPGYVLAGRIQNDAPPPPNYIAELKARTARAERATREQAEAAQREAVAQAAVDEEARLDAAYERLDARNRKRVDDIVAERLGVLGALGKAGGALAAARRNVMREIMGSHEQVA